MLRSPVLWGAAGSVAFYAVVHTLFQTNQYVQRYFAGHPVDYIETIAFFVGLAFLILRAVDVRAQLGRLEQALLGEAPSGGQPVTDCDSLLTRLANLPARRQGDYLVARVRDALTAVRRAGTAEKLDDELKYLADMGAVNVQGSYGLVRVIIWAIPILGFLGTVIGITMAIAVLSPQALEESLPAVTKGLGVAFDTTAQALGLSMVLMFGQYWLDRVEGRLLARVEARAAEELTGRFEQYVPGGDGQVAAVRRIAETVLQTAERLVQRQTELWQATIEAAHERWSQLVSTGQKQMETALAGALSQSLKAHAGQLAAVEQTAAERNRRHWEQVQKALSGSAEAVAAQQLELVKQGEVLLKIVDATGQVAKVEETLNRNLTALAGSRNFEETVLSLSAAIHLLNARLRPGQADAVELTQVRRTGQAA
jgi:biopolymer transport protein ExbB/TolQ